MYFDERLARTRALSAEGEDDAVPMIRNAVHPGRELVEAEDDDDASPLRAGEH